MTTELLSKSTPIVNRKLIPLDRLTNAPWNPPRRIIPARLRKLVDSMERLGLLNAVVISQNNQIIEGHRRVAAARLLGWQDVECVVIRDDEDASAIYSSVNESVAKHSGNDLIMVWLKNHDAVPERWAATFAAMKSDIGLRLVQSIAREGWTYSIYQIARRLANYCECPGLARDFTRWLLEHGQIATVRQMLLQGVAPAIFEKALEANKPVAFQAVVGE